MDISICITTYKHEKFIAACLESVLSQKFEGSYEIIIGDDSPDDATGNIIRNIATKHISGDRIIYFKNNPALGYVKNTLATFTKATGKYIAVLDGDDEWIDRQKLQMQYDFLEANPEFSGVGSDSEVIWEGTDKPNNSFSDFPGAIADKPMLLQRMLCQTSTFFFRKEILKMDFPNDIISADRCLYLLAGCFGNIKILPEKTSTYRKFPDSLSRNVSFDMMRKDLAIIPFILKYGPDYRGSRLKKYFFYTLMSYPTSLTRGEFRTAAAGYLLHTVAESLRTTPGRLYHDLKWARQTIHQKKEYHHENGHFSA